MYGAIRSLGATAYTGAVTYSSTAAFTGAVTMNAPTIGEQNPVTASGGTTRTLLAANSGSLNLFDSAAGITYTLPVPAVGLYYDFFWTTLQTSSNHIIITDAASTYLLGYLTMFSDVDVTPSSTLGPKGFAGNGTSHIKITMNATTLGGGIGSNMRLTCISSTQWAVTGVVRSPSGTIATPFST